MQKLTEDQIEQQCLQWLNFSGYFAWKVKDQVAFRDGAYRKPKPFMIPGVSDVIAIKQGVVYFIEFKSATGTQSVKQKEFQKNIEMQNGNYILARSLDELKEKLVSKTR